ncbi:MAG: hypothetical protein ACK4S4_11380 [Pyrinomonadaceae bacterium]
MPLSAKARIEVYLPDLPNAIYTDVLTTYSREFTSAFGGCTILKGLEGSYLSHSGQVISDRINLVYTDTPFDIERNLQAVAAYADAIRLATDEALDEETVLVAVSTVYHSE